MTDELIFNELRKRGLTYRPDAEVAFLLDDSYYRSFLSYFPVLDLFSHPEAQRYQSMIGRSARMYVLTMQSFQKKWTSHALCCAVAFTLLGCFLDDQIDEGTAEERSSARKLLSWEEGCGRYFEGRESRADSFAESLLLELGIFMQNIRNSDLQGYDILISELRRVAKAEGICASAMKHPGEKQYVIEKSVLFVLVGFRIAASGRLSNKEEQLCSLIGETKRIIDDLCDLESDSVCGHMNSISCGENSEEGLKKRIFQSFAELDDSLHCLQKNLSPLLFHYLIFELQQWTLENEYMRQRSWENHS